ncbi:zinc finger protein 541 isoform X3 [Lepisosteus oculatus]
MEEHRQGALCAEEIIPGLCANSQPPTESPAPPPATADSPREHDPSRASPFFSPLGWRQQEGAGREALPELPAGAPEKPPNPSWGPAVLEEAPAGLSRAAPAPGWRGPAAREPSPGENVFHRAGDLHKHPLSHGQDRGRVCSQSCLAFGRSDPSSDHVLTHMRRQPFPCTEPGCLKTFCDARLQLQHNATHHCQTHAPSHGIAAPDHAGEGRVYLGTPVSQDDCQLSFWFPPATSLKVASGARGCGYNPSSLDYARFIDQRGGNPLESSTTQVPTFSQLDPWSEPATRGTASEMTAELQPELYAPSLELDSSPVTERAAHSPGSQHWENRLKFPSSELQDLDEILSAQTYRDTEEQPGVKRTGILISPDMSAQPCTVTEYSVDPTAVGQTGPDYQPVSTVTGSTHVETTPSPSCNPSPNYSTAASSNSTHSCTSPAPWAQVSLASPPPPAPQPSAVPPLLTQPPSKDPPRRRRVRKIKAKKAESLAPPLPPPRPASHCLSRRHRPRPLCSPSLISPSQVAMASFSSHGMSCEQRQGRISLAVSPTAAEGRGAGDRAVRDVAPGGRCEDMGQTDEHKPSKKVKHRPLNAGAPEKEAHGESAEGQAGRGEASQQGPGPAQLSVDKADLSLLVTPVSLLEPGAPNADAAQLSLCMAKRALESEEGWSRAQRCEFQKTLYILPPTTPPAFPPAFVGEEGFEGGQVPRFRDPGGYPSQLRSPVCLTNHLLNPDFLAPPYTPPPMLSPLRPGTGLYFGTLTHTPPSRPLSGTYTATLDATDGIFLVMDDTIITIEPRINVGVRFQAEIPPLCSPLLVLQEEHPAQLVWTPWGDISHNAVTQHRVTEFLELCCCSAMPGGGTNTELALHCLNEAQGNILTAVELLLMQGARRSPSHPLWDYHYAGSDHWSSREKKLFCKALATYDREFQLIHSMLKSKSVPQCVEYYYTMKKKKKFKRRSREAQRQQGYSRRESPCSPQKPGVEGTGSPQKSMERQCRLPGSRPAAGGARKHPCNACDIDTGNIKSRSSHLKVQQQQDSVSPSWNSWINHDQEEEEEEAGLSPGSDVTWSPFFLHQSILFRVCPATPGYLTAPNQTARRAPAVWRGPVHSSLCRSLTGETAPVGGGGVPLAGSPEESGGPSLSRARQRPWWKAIFGGVHAQVLTPFPAPRRESQQ